MSNIKVLKLILFLAIGSILSAQTLELIGPPGGIVRRGQLVVHPTENDLVYSATWYGALFRTENNNSPIPVETYFKDELGELALPPLFKNYIFAKSFNPIYTSNSGTTWNVIDEEVSFSRTNYTFNPVNPEIMYMSVRDTVLMRSSDFGKNWEKLNKFENDIYDITISEDNPSKMYLSTEKGEIFLSTDSGTNWVLMNSWGSFLGEPYEIVINPFNDNTIYVQSPGGIYKSNDTGKTYLRLLESLNVTSFALDPTDTLTLYASIGDYIFAPDGGIIKTTDEGKTWASKVNGIEGSYVTANILRINPQNPNILYAGIGALGVYKTTNGGDNWFLTKASCKDVSTINADKNNPGTILSGQYGWASMKTTNYGENWYHPAFDTEFQELNSGTEFSFNPSNPNEGYLAANEGLYKTTDGGDNWNIYRQSQNVNAVAYHPRLDGLYSIQTNQGITEQLIMVNHGITMKPHTW
jgi:photosystem II stability/assembly factor-like uncharacterized protein